MVLNLHGTVMLGHAYTCSYMIAIGKDTRWTLLCSCSTEREVVVCCAQEKDQDREHGGKAVAPFEGRWPSFFGPGVSRCFTTFLRPHGCP